MNLQCLRIVAAPLLCICSYAVLTVNCRVFLLLLLLLTMLLMLMLSLLVVLLMLILACAMALVDRALSVHDVPHRATSTALPRSTAHSRPISSFYPSQVSF